MKILLRCTYLLAAFGVAGTAFADTITLTPEDCDAAYPCWTSFQNNAEDAGSLQTITGGTYAAEDLTLLYRGIVGDLEVGDNPDEGTFADNYDTVFMNDPLDPMNAWISWLDNGASIDCSSGCLAVVKDGNHEPNIYVFEVFWDGEMDIHFEGFWPNQGAISHVSIWGGDSTRVPEPGTLALFGLGLFGMGLIRRRRTS